MSANLAEKLANAHITKLLFIRSTFSLLPRIERRPALDADPPRAYA
jgi:hypothetical protein